MGRNGGTQPGASRMSSQTFARRLGRKRREGESVHTGERVSRPGAAIVVVEVVACSRVSQRSDIRQCSSESGLEIKIEAGHHRSPIDARIPANKD